MVGGEQEDAAEFGVNPALLEQVGLVKKESKAEAPGGKCGGEHNIMIELAGHGVEGRVGGCGAFGDIDKNTGKIKKAGKPCYHADKVESFEREVDFHGRSIANF